MFAEFAFLKNQGDIVTGQNTDYDGCQCRRTNWVCAAGDIGLPVKKFVAVVTPNSRPLDASLCYFQVQATEYVQNWALLAPLPLTNTAILFFYATTK